MAVIESAEAGVMLLVALLVLMALLVLIAFRLSGLKPLTWLGF